MLKQSVRICLSGVLLGLCSQVAIAQDIQSGSTSEPVERTAQAGDSTEGLNSGRGGFLGLGGQKPLQRVRGVPLPTRPGQMATNSLLPQSSSVVRESSANYSVRRAKPLVGELTTDFPARMIYLNGKNVSSVRDQQLDGVNVRIDANGNVHISASHYEVQESSHYRPLLPHEVPKVSKPAPAADSPLIPGGRYSKSAPSPQNESAPAAGGVPPVESEDSESQESPQSNSAPAKQKANEPAPAPDTSKAAPKGI